MSRLLQKLAPTARAAASRVAAPRRNLTAQAGEYTQADYKNARDNLMGLAGASVFIAYAGYVLAGEPAHDEAHPYYAAPYVFSKRAGDPGTGWWPGRHCAFFEFNCFAQTYAEADYLLAELKKNGGK